MQGHWEVDMMKGAYNRSAVVTLAVRTSRYVLLAKMDGSNENIIRLICQFLPKGMDLSQLSHRMINRISLLLNKHSRGRTVFVKST